MIHVVLHKDPFKEGRECLVPERWEELTGEQLAEIAFILYSDADHIAKLTRCTRVLLGVSGDYFATIDPEVILEELVPLAMWVQEEVDLTEQLLPELKAGGQVYYGPHSALGNLRFVEFDFAERALFEYNMSRTREALYRFVACLYRPMVTIPEGVADREKWIIAQGDKREPFNDNLVEHYGKFLQQYLPPRYAFAALLFYKGCRKHLVELFPMVFDSTVIQQQADGEDQEVKPAAESHEPSYLPLMRMIANAGTYGDFDKVENMYLHNALFEMEQQRIEYLRQKEMTDTNKYEP